jgi:hypothetical protein
MTYAPKWEQQEKESENGGDIDYDDDENLILGCNGRGKV